MGIKKLIVLTVDIGGDKQWKQRFCFDDSKSSALLSAFKDFDTGGILSRQAYHEQLCSSAGQSLSKQSSKYPFNEGSK